MSRVQILITAEPMGRSAARAPGALLVAVVALLTGAIFLNDGNYGNGPAAVTMLGGAFVLLLAAALIPEAFPHWLSCPSVLVATMVLCLGAYFALSMVWPPAAYPRFVVILTAGDEKYLALHGLNFYWSLMAMAAVLMGTLVGKKGALGLLTFPALVLAQLVLSFWIIHADPTPFVDVFAFQQAGVHALLSGHDPYATPMPNITADLPNHGVFYGPGIENGNVLKMGFPYMPLSLAVSLIGAMPDDVRYASAAALTAAALLIGYSRPGRIAKLAAVGLLFMPRTLFVIDWAWTEPIVLLFLALTVFCALRRPRMMPYALGLLMASKQYMAFAIVLLPLLAGWERRRLIGAAIRACAMAVAVTLPGILAHPRSFFDSVVMWQIRQPFRPDALSFPAAVRHLFGPQEQLPTSIAFIVLIAAAALALWRYRPSPAGFAVAVALVYFGFFAFNKQAFMNYYFFVIGAIWCAVAAMDLPEADNPHLPPLASAAGPAARRTSR